jgi:hypothetical protein
MRFKKCLFLVIVNQTAIDTSLKITSTRWAKALPKKALIRQNKAHKGAFLHKISNCMKKHKKVFNGRENSKSRMNNKNRKLRFPIVHLPLIFQSHKRNLPKSRHLVFFKGSMKTQKKRRLRTF